MAIGLEAPPLRAKPFEVDTQLDGKRVEYGNKLWGSQNEALERRDRQIEENVRMLVGQQWIVWSQKTRRFVDINEFLSRTERRSKQRPVVNRIGYTFIINHSRMTENPPIVGFNPSTSDKSDSDLAATMDILSKSLWQDLGMVDVYSRMFAWEYVGGRAYIKVRVDPDKGEVRDFLGKGTVTNPLTGQELPITGEDGEQVDVPFNQDEEGRFVPQVEFDPTTGGAQVTGDAWKEHEGGLVMDVLGPLECRGEWGHNIPWHKKSWHEQESYMTPDEIERLFAIKVQAEGDLANEGGELERLMRGAGYFGAADQGFGWMDHAFGAPEGLVRVRSLWVAPGHHGSPDRTDSSPGGRMLVITRDKVLYDGPRPAAYPYTSPIHAYDFMQLPGRPHGSSPLEWMNPLQRLYNRIWAQLLEHQNLLSNPKIVVDSGTGLRTGQITNEPGQILRVTRRPGVPAVEYVGAPRMGEDSYRLLGMLNKEMEDIGNVAGAEGRVPQVDDNSGALIRELRFNSDRYLGNPLRQAAEETGRMWESVMAVLPVIWDQEKIINWAGEDNILRTLTVTPDLWKGKINVKPDLESMLPESRQQRQERVEKLFLMGAYGDPAIDPAAMRKFLTQARFPHLDAAVQPGGNDELMARITMGQMVAGQAAEEVDLYPWYDFGVWLESLENFMTTPSWADFELTTKNEFVKFRTILREALGVSSVDDAEIEARLAAEIEANSVAAQLESGGPQLAAAASQALSPPVGEDGEPVEGPPSPEEGVGKQNASVATPPEAQ